MASRITNAENTFKVVNWRDALKDAIFDSDAHQTLVLVFTTSLSHLRGDRVLTQDYADSHE
jgi:hypothetical protein